MQSLETVEASRQQEIRVKQRNHANESERMALRVTELERMLAAKEKILFIYVSKVLELEGRNRELTNTLKRQEKEIDRITIQTSESNAMRRKEKIRLSKLESICNRSVEAENISDRCPDAPLRAAGWRR